MFWFKKPYVLVEHPYDFVPHSRMTVDEILNSLVRLSLYVCFILVSLQKIEKGLFIVFIVSIMSILLHAMSTDMTEKKSTIEPTVHNPFMNIQVHEYTNPNSQRNIESPYHNVSIENESIKNKISEKFSQSTDHAAFTFNTMDSLFGRNTSERQFYTMPVTTIPSPQHEYAQWLYGTKGETCKENNARCTL